MARRVPRQPVALALGLVLAPLVGTRAGAATRPSPTLVSYSFEDELATGPDTFAVFERSKGRVQLTRSFRWSGYRSVEIRDVAGDGEFPELQGYFALREFGKLHAHFALLTTDPLETFNLALAGPRGFTLDKDGIAFWMLSRDGFLCHYSDSMSKKLFSLRPFVWYLVDAAYDIEAGSYDLVVHEEGVEQPVVSLTDQVNAAHQPRSSVDKFSFIGDTGDDASNVVYYVDDVVVAVDRPTLQTAFIAPGRRKLFVDAWNDWQKMTRKRPKCLPAVELADFGAGAEQAVALEQAGVLASFEALLGGARPELGSLSVPSAPDFRRLVDGAVLHYRGCSALEQGRAGAALELLDNAARLVPEARIYDLSAAMALGRSAEELSDAALEGPLPEQHFFVLLWKGSLRRAERYATQMVERLASSGRPSALWLERAADAAFLAGDVEAARQGYTLSLEQRPKASLLLTKLADVYFLLGDIERERQLRETVYGRLAEDE